MVLVVGPHYKNHRGGIGALIDIQKDHYLKFNFIPTYIYYNNNLFKTLFFGLQIFKIISYLIFHKQIKLLHIHSSIRGSFYRKFIIILIAKFIFRKKIINHLHAGDYDIIYNNSTKFHRRVMHKYFSLSDATITVSRPVREYISAQFGIKNVHFIKNVIALSVPPAKVITQHPTTFLFLGLVCDYKGIFDLINVLITNRSALRSRVRLLIGGNGQIERLEKTISENKLEDIVEYKGWVSGINKHLMMLEADVFILPSYSEGMPISVLEAMSYKMPVISTCVGGIPDLVEHNINGKLVSPGDQIALYQAIDFYLSYPEKITEHGELSGKLIQSYFPEDVMPKFEALYRSLV